MPSAEPQTVEVRDGRTVLIRPISHEDRELLRDAFHRLSDASRQRRFLTPVNELTEEDLHYLVDVDHRRHEAMVALDPAEGRMVGVARYVRVPGDRETAEVAVTVADDWQRRGVATALLDALSARARENGVERYCAYVASDNEVVLAALTRAGAERANGEAGELEFAVDVPSEGLPDRLREALRAAASGQLSLVARAWRRLGVWPRG